MMERYSGMATEAMEGYIGAVKSLDQALQRMPAARFDTTMGHALTTPPESYRADAYSVERSLEDAVPAIGGLRPGGLAANRAAYGDEYYEDEHLDGESYDDGYSDDRYYGTNGGRWTDQTGYAYGRDPRYLDPRYVDPRYVDPRYADPRYADPRYLDPRYTDPRYEGRGYGYGDPRGYGVDPRGAYGARGYDPRYGRDPYQDPRARRFPDDPRGGALRPPEDRLRRPWLEEEAVGRYDARIRADSAARPRPRPRRDEE